MTLRHKAKSGEPGGHSNGAQSSHMRQSGGSLEVGPCCCCCHLQCTKYHPSWQIWMPIQDNRASHCKMAHHAEVDGKGQEQTCDKEPWFPPSIARYWLGILALSEQLRIVSIIIFCTLSVLIITNHFILI